MAPPFKCDDCEFKGLYYKIFNIHKGKQHKKGAQADGIDNEDIIEDLSLHTFILQREVTEDPDDEDIPVGETFWRLQEVLYLDPHVFVGPLSPGAALIVKSCDTNFSV